MLLSRKSKEILKKSKKPTVFKVEIIYGDIIEIGEEINDIKGSVLIFADDLSEVLELVSSHLNLLDWVFFADSSLNIEIIGRPDIDEQVGVSELFERIFESSGFQKREEQLKIANFVYKWLENGLVGMVEAPTGTGKSLSYLVPSIIFSKRYSKKVVISTNTINLQHQLIEKEIPFLKRFVNFRSDIALGRNNYLCKRKAELYLNRGSLFLFESDIYKEIKDFMSSAKDGTKSEFFSRNRSVSSEFWGALESSSLTCARKICPYYKNGCFFYRARKKLDKADLIIANHHIIFSNSLIESSDVLPEFDALIFDEAHNIEKNATNYYTQTVNSKEIMTLLNMLYNKGKKGKFGFLVGVAEDNLLLKVDDIKIKLKEIFNTILLDLREREIKIDESSFYKFKGYITDIIGLIDSLLISVRELLAEKKGVNFVDVKSVCSTLSNSVSLLEEFLNWDSSNNIFWIKSYKQSVHFNITPIQVKEALNEYIYNKVPSIVFVSATLTVNDKFDFFKQSVGIDRAEGFIAETSFNYQTNCRMFLVENMPFPDSSNYIKEVSFSIVNIARALKGRKGILILFTSYNMLNLTFNLSRDALTKLGFNVLRQGDLDNFELLKRFKEGRGVLFATSSFWEGVDVKGEELSVLVITKLPFEVPTTVVESAKFDALKKEGGNAFLEYSLPKAVLRFKQGLGRLIRDRDDKGVMVILDSRIVNKSYGKMFLNSVKYIRQERIKSYEIKECITDFFSDFDN